MKTVQSELAASMRKNCDKTAVKRGHTQITYKELDLTTDLYAGEFLRYKQYDKVIIICDDKINTIKAMLACLKANKIFVILDLYAPVKRNINIVNQIDKYFIVTDSIDKCNNIISEKVEKVIITNLENVESVRNDFCTTKIKYKADSPCYIYFTSGTTKNPKGVIGRNESLINFLLWEIREFNITSEEVFGQLTSPSFDPFLRDILVPLISGASIVLRENDNIIFYPEKFFRWCRSNNVNVLHITPGLLNSLCCRKKEAENEFKLLFIAGQKIMPGYVDVWNECFDKKTLFINLYGPTEATLAKCFYVIDRNRKYESDIPVGKPIINTRIFIIDKKGNICGKNKEGEICIESQDLTYGYLDKTLNQGRFINGISDSKLKMYRTGDSGYLNENNEVVVTGRNDRQIKINGIRVELDEVEAVMLGKENIVEAAVIFNDGRLEAFYVGDAQVSGLKRYMSQYLIKSCIPVRFTQLMYMPLNINGKKDYKTLKNLNNLK